MRLLLLLFVTVPVIEMYILIRVGGEIGAWPTIALVLLTAMIGVALLRQQGFSTLTRGVRRLDAGEVPAQELLEGLLLAIGGALLLTPGFLTDAFGFACLVPVTRRAMVAWLLRRGVVTMASGAESRVYRRRDGTHVIEGELDGGRQDDDAGPSR